MQITPMTPERAAAFIIRLTKGRPDPEAVARTYRVGADQMREFAGKAASSKGGKYRGKTAAEWSAHAKTQAHMAEAVPPILRRLAATL